MSDFEEQRAAVARLRQQVEAQRVETLLAREAARRDGREEARFKRASEELNRMRGQLNEVLDVFQPFTDPSEQLAKLSDEVPILLFPLRLETRFRPIGRGRHQLWVRFYPDSCLIDTFEASLTDQEAENARLFWQQHA